MQRADTRWRLLALPFLAVLLLGPLAAAQHTPPLAAERRGEAAEQMKPAGVQHP